MIDETGTILSPQLRLFKISLVRFCRLPHVWRVPNGPTEFTHGKDGLKARLGGLISVELGVLQSFLADAAEDRVDQIRPVPPTICRAMGAEDD